eukprot:9466117-Karenia_brevis.AAC.1
MLTNHAGGKQFEHAGQAPVDFQWFSYNYHIGLARNQFINVLMMTMMLMMMTNDDEMTMTMMTMMTMLTMMLMMLM